jgi:hypothetical protein
MFAKPILLNNLTSRDSVFSEQTHNLNGTTKTLYIEAIFYVFFALKEPLKRFQIKTIQFKEDYFHFVHVSRFLRMYVLTSTLDETLFSQPCQEVCPQHESHSDGLQSIHVRRYSPFWGLEYLKRRLQSYLSPALLPIFLYCILRVTTIKLITISLL